MLCGEHIVTPGEFFIATCFLGQLYLKFEVNYLSMRFNVNFNHSAKLLFKYCIDIIGCSFVDELDVMTKYGSNIEHSRVPHIHRE